MADCINHSNKSTKSKTVLNQMQYFFSLYLNNHSKYDYVCFLEQGNRSFKQKYFFLKCGVLRYKLTINRSLKCFLFCKVLQTSNDCF